jgi:putative N-acetylmannosamine-6-phosphate epimerase
VKFWARAVAANAATMKAVNCIFIADIKTIDLKIKLPIVNLFKSDKL